MTSIEMLKRMQSDELELAPHKCRWNDPDGVVVKGTAEWHESRADALTDALRALEQEAQLLEELGELRTLVRNPTKWMAWCDSQILERAEQAEAEVTRLRAQEPFLREAIEDLREAAVTAEREVTRLRAWKAEALLALKNWCGLGDALMPFAQVRLGEDIPTRLTEQIPAELTRLRALASPVSPDNDATTAQDVRGERSDR